MPTSRSTNACDGGVAFKARRRKLLQMRIVSPSCSHKVDRSVSQWVTEQLFHCHKLKLLGGRSISEYVVSHVERFACSIGSNNRSIKLQEEKQQWKRMCLRNVTATLFQPQGSGLFEINWRHIDFRAQIKTRTVSYRSGERTILGTKSALSDDQHTAL